MHADRSAATSPAASWREHFLLPDGLYLDTAAHAPRLRAVQDAAQHALDARRVAWHVEWDAWVAQVERVRALAAGLFDGDADAVALVPSAGYALTLASRALPLAAGDAVLLLADAFPSELLPWQHRCIETGARLVAVQRGADATAAVLDALAREPAVRVVSLPHVHWHDGMLVDLDAIAPVVHARGAALVLDLSQSLGALATAFDRWRPVFAVSVGYKWLLGPMGLSYLWASPHWREHAAPLEHNWIATQAREDWRFDVDTPAGWRAGARRFDAGGIADPQRVAMAEAGLAQLHAWGLDAVSSHLGALTAALRQRVGDGFETPAVHAPHLVGLRPRAASAEGCVQRLRAASIVCTARHGRLRIAPHRHVDLADIERVAGVLADAR